MYRCLLIVACLMACGGEDGPTPEESCLDIAEEWGRLCDRCDVDDYLSCYDSIAGDCYMATSIRDVDALYDVCIPWMQTVSCSYVSSDDFELDSSCEGQLN